MFLILKVYGEKESPKNSVLAGKWHILVSWDKKLNFGIPSTWYGFSGSGFLDYTCYDQSDLILIRLHLLDHAFIMKMRPYKDFFRRDVCGGSGYASAFWETFSGIEKPPENFPTPISNTLKNLLPYFFFNIL